MAEYRDETFYAFVENEPLIESLSGIFKVMADPATENSVCSYARHLQCVETRGAFRHEPIFHLPSADPSKRGRADSFEKRRT